MCSFNKHWSSLSYGFIAASSWRDGTHKHFKSGVLWRSRIMHSCSSRRADGGAPHCWCSGVRRFFPEEVSLSWALKDTGKFAGNKRHTQVTKAGGIPHVQAWRGCRERAGKGHCGRCQERKSSCLEPRLRVEPWWGMRSDRNNNCQHLLSTCSFPGTVLTTLYVLTWSLQLPYEVSIDTALI